MTYHYIRTGTGRWTVGTGTPPELGGTDWVAESEHDSPSSAIARVRDLNGGTADLTPQLARKGHCTLGGTIASGDALCQCGAWAAGDYPDAETRKTARKEHLALVGEMRREAREAQNHDTRVRADVEMLRQLVNSPITRAPDIVERSDQAGIGWRCRTCESAWSGAKAAHTEAECRRIQRGDGAQ